MRSRRALLLVLSLAIVLAVSGFTACTSTGTNNVQSFDKQAFNTLLVAQAALEQAKIEVQGTQYVHEFNEVVKHYNTAYDAYVAFHNAVEIGTNTNSENLRQQLVALLGEIANLRQVLGKQAGEVKP